MGYRGKLAEREEARRLRALGQTMPDIAAALGVSRSSVSLWARDVPVQLGPRRTTQPRRPNALERAKQSEIADLLESGRARIGELSEREFLVAGVALYAGEGSKTDGRVRFTNSSAQMICFFCAWLRAFFPLDESRLRLTLYLHEGLDLDAACEYWSAMTAIPRSRIGKPYRAVPDVGIRHNKHEYGCVSVSYSCSRTHRAIMGLVQGLLSCDLLPG